MHCCLSFCIKRTKQYHPIHLNCAYFLVKALFQIGNSRKTTAERIKTPFFSAFTSNRGSDHVVFDQYWDISIKAGERLRRGASSALEIQIGGPATPIPKQWGKYIANPKNKVILI